MKKVTKLILTCMMAICTSSPSVWWLSVHETTPIRSNKRKIIFFMSQKIHNAKIPKKHACRQRKDTFSVKVNKSEQRWTTFFWWFGFCAYFCSDKSNTPMNIISKTQNKNYEEEKHYRHDCYSSGFCSECSSQPEPAPAPITNVECQDDNNPNNRCTIIHRECSDLSNSIISAFS